MQLTLTKNNESDIFGPKSELTLFNSKTITLKMNENSIKKNDSITFCNEEKEVSPALDAKKKSVKKYNEYLFKFKRNREQNFL